MRDLGIFIAASALLTAACASRAPLRVIEPTSAGGSGTAHSSGAVTGSEDNFTLSRKPAKSAAAANAEYPIHLAEKWLPFRAEYLHITVPAAAARDASISDTAAPDEFWDEQTAIESVSIWSALCNECHGGRRKIKDALTMTPPRAGWGRGEGLFFGKRKLYREVFNTISKGGPERDGKPSEMPSWKPRLSVEQIWSLIYFLEYQSGGIEGVFPPSLYPRGGDDGSGG